jgi:hypothetical protein
VLVPSDVRPESTCGQNSESAMGFHRRGDPTAKRGAMRCSRFEIIAPPTRIVPNPWAISPASDGCHFRLTPDSRH